MTNQQLETLEKLMNELEQNLENDVKFYKIQLDNWEFWASNLLHMWEHIDNSNDEKYKWHLLKQIQNILYTVLIRNVNNRKKYENESEEN